LRDALRGAGVEVYKGVHRFLNCHGLGLCGTCYVLVKEGMENLAPTGTTKADWEKRQAQVKQNGSAPVPKTRREGFTLSLALLNPLAWVQLASVGHEDEMRLSCQVQVFGDCAIETRPAFNWSGENFWQKPYPNK